MPATFPAAQAELSDACREALLRGGADLTDRIESQRSHFSHESIWAVRERLLMSDPAAWHAEVKARYGIFIHLYKFDQVQEGRFKSRMNGAFRGDASELGELQIAEKYLLDPNVEYVKWIREVKNKTPDFIVHYADGGAKLVEVKTRCRDSLPPGKHLSSRMRDADEQVADFKVINPQYRNLRTEVEFVFFLPDGAPYPQVKLQSLSDEALKALKVRDHLTRVTLHINNHPFYRAARTLKDGASEEHGVWLHPPVLP